MSAVPERERKNRWPEEKLNAVEDGAGLRGGGRGLGTPPTNQNKERSEIKWKTKKTTKKETHVRLSNPRRRTVKKNTHESEKQNIVEKNTQPTHTHTRNQW